MMQVVASDTKNMSKLVSPTHIIVSITGIIGIGKVGGVGGVGGVSARPVVFLWSVVCLLSGY